MADPPQKHPHADLMMASLNRMAMKILEVPKSEREGLYGDFQSGFVKDAAVSGLDPNAPAAKREAEEDWGGDMRGFLRLGAYLAPKELQLDVFMNNAADAEVDALIETMRQVIEAKTNPPMKLIEQKAKADA